MKPFRIVTNDQRTPEWHRARVGKLTGTDADALLAKATKDGPSAKTRDLLLGLAVEQMTGESTDSTFVSADMQRGSELESEAVIAYELRTDRVVHPVGFIELLELPAVGCSLDGQVDDFAGIVEVKCPKTTTHVDYWRAGKVPTEYLRQITHNLFVSGAEWCDFVSYDPRLPEAGRLFIRRVRREDVDLKAYELVVRMFLRQVEQERELLAKLFTSATVTA